jgi:hypothetical protein
MPQSLAECDDGCEAKCPGDPNCWAECFQACAMALCEAGILENFE